MSIWRPRTAAMLAVCQLSGTAFAQVSSPVSLTATGTASTQNFDTLASTGTSSATPAGYGFAESGSNADTNYAVSTGSGTAGDTYSFGATGNTERAFGGLQSGSLVPTIGAAFTNNTGTTITSLVIAYTGEQWRLGATGRTDRLDFQYSLNATSLTTGTWVDVNALDFAAPISTGTAGALNGNAAANQAAVSASISSLSIATGASFLLRWNSFDATGADDGLAIDNFSITPQGTVGNTPPTLSYNPASSVNFPAGLSGATVNASIVVTPSGGAGSGAAATTTVNACAISGAGAAAFGAISGQPLSFVGSTTTAANLGLSCTIAARSAGADDASKAAAAGRLGLGVEVKRWQRGASGELPHCAVTA